MSRPDHEGDEAGRCGGCGQYLHATMRIESDRTLMGYCVTCDRLQEVETRNWPEQKMCDNCAFRKGSPERADPYRWAEIQEVVESGQAFHCHKGLPFNLKTGKFTAPDPRQGRVTVCAGWLASRIAFLKRKEDLPTPVREGEDA